ncbi:hypothetical protein LOTGIDRAFT_161656 [Lottia gigantea]|uniref:Uncharacterized protein n=1 Tax=Lottia gigantea TaxID=225164 RepID=V4AEI5_LOTGI|nr:hypothetical protein LOTGIDRAFT_161656 [Lottia gigantea]ESO93550.1 hypothetical protein LOTGIDRAFT_161656 [Lottia gigantea]
MKLVIVLVLSLTAVYNQGFQSKPPVENIGNPGSLTNIQNPRIRRTPNPYYGLYNYLYSSPYFNRPAAMTRRIGAPRGVLRNPQQQARPAPTRVQAPAPGPQRAQAVQRNRAQAVPNNVNPYGFGRRLGMLGALNGMRDRSRLGRHGGPDDLNGLVGRNQDRSRHVDGIRGIGLGGGLYRAMSGSGWKSYGSSSGGKGSYYYRHTGSSGGYGGSYKGSYYYRGGSGGGHGTGHGHGHGHGHGNSYWSRR